MNAAGVFRADQELLAGGGGGAVMRGDAVGKMALLHASTARGSPPKVANLNNNKNINNIIKNNNHQRWLRI